MPAVWSLFVVHSLPSLREYFCVFEREEDFGIEDFSTVRPDEALSMSILPRLAGVDVRHADAVAFGPHPYGVGDELTSVVAAEKRWPAILLHRLVEHMLDISSFERWCHGYFQCIGRSLVLDQKAHEPPSVLKPVLREVHAPDTVRPCGRGIDTAATLDLAVLPAPEGRQAHLLPQATNTAKAAHLTLVPQPPMNQPVAPRRMLQSQRTHPIDQTRTV